MRTMRPLGEMQIAMLRCMAEGRNGTAWFKWGTPSNKARVLESLERRGLIHYGDDGYVTTDEGRKAAG